MRFNSQKLRRKVPNFRPLGNQSNAFSQYSIFYLHIICKSISELLQTFLVLRFENTFFKVHRKLLASKEKESRCLLQSDASSTSVALTQLAADFKQALLSLYLTILINSLFQYLEEEKYV